MVDEALRAYRDKLSKEVDAYQFALDAMKEGRQETHSIDRATGRRTDLTPQRIEDFTSIITNLKSVIRDLDIKLGDKRDNP